MNGRPPGEKETIEAWREMCLVHPPRHWVKNRVITQLTRRRGLVGQAEGLPAQRSPQVHGRKGQTPALSDCGRHFEDRKIHRDHDKPNDSPQEHHHRRLKQRRERRNCLIDLILVEICNFSQHRVQGAG